MRIIVMSTPTTPSPILDGKSLSTLYKDVDAMIANELSAMSMKERESCYYDIHGVSDVIEETPGWVEGKLVQLEVELAKISQNWDAYLQAAAQHQEYARARIFRLKFLRAERFDVKAAAQRLVRFFEEKRKLFGHELLAKDIKISDLDGDTRQCLESGVCQVLPKRDRAGRCIIAYIVANGDQFQSDDLIAKTRVSWNFVFKVSNQNHVHPYSLSPHIHNHLFRCGSFTTCLWLPLKTKKHRKRELLRLW